MTPLWAQPKESHARILKGDGGSQGLFFCSWKPYSITKRLYKNMSNYIPAAADFFPGMSVSSLAVAYKIIGHECEKSVDMNCGVHVYVVSNSAETLTSIPQNSGKKPRRSWRVGHHLCGNRSSRHCYQCSEETTTTPRITQTAQAASLWRRTGTG